MKTTIQIDYLPVTHPLAVNTMLFSIVTVICCLWVIMIVVFGFLNPTNNAERVLGGRAHSPRQHIHTQ